MITIFNLLHRQWYSVWVSRLPRHEQMTVMIKTVVLTLTFNKNNNRTKTNKQQVLHFGKSESFFSCIYSATLSAIEQHSLFVNFYINEINSNYFRRISNAKILTWEPSFLYYLKYSSSFKYSILSILMRVNPEKRTRSFNILFFF